MLGVFEACTAVGMAGLTAMAGMQLGHGHAGGHDAGGGHVGDSGGHLGDLGHLDAGGAHLGHLDAGGAHLGHMDAGGAHLGHMDAGGAHLGHADAGGAHLGGHLDAGGHAGHADVGGAHPGHADAGHVDQAHAMDVQQAGHGYPAHAHAHHGTDGDSATFPLWLIPSPIQVFSWMIGFGLGGMVFSQWVPISPALYALAAGSAIGLERLVVRPYWQLLFRFASAPGTNLEGTVASRATAVTSFDAKGHGLVRVCVDGQDHDVLAHLMPGQTGLPVHKGDVLFVERANEDNSVLVSRPDTAQKG